MVRIRVIRARSSTENPKRTARVRRLPGYPHIAMKKARCE